MKSAGAGTEVKRLRGGYSDVTIPDDVTVLLVDGIGELASLYRLADGVFVGGSLVESGGHNILEPAAFGKVPVFGPSMENFAEMASRFVAAKSGGAGGEPGRRGRGVDRVAARSGAAARDERDGEAVGGESRGATERAMAEIAKYLRPEG